VGKEKKHEGCADECADVLPWRDRPKLTGVLKRAYLVQDSASGLNSRLNSHQIQPAMY
jgi:hypothetical protein